MDGFVTVPRIAEPRPATFASDDDVAYSEADIDAILEWWDAELPDWAGLLAAELEGEE